MLAVYLTFFGCFLFTLANSSPVDRNAIILNALKQCQVYENSSDVNQQSIFSLSKDDERIAAKYRFDNKAVCMIKQWNKLSFQELEEIMDAIQKCQNEEKILILEGNYEQKMFLFDICRFKAINMVNADNSINLTVYKKYLATYPIIEDELNKLDDESFSIAETCANEKSTSADETLGKFLQCLRKNISSLHVTSN